MSFLLTNFFKNPSWLKTYNLQVDKFEDFSQDYIDQVKFNLQKAVSDEPIVSVIITTYNEEANVVRCLDSISRNKSSYPFELVIIENNSTDQTRAALDALGVRYVNQPIQGSGPARQMGLEKAKGKYIVLGDSDCIYPKKWIQGMVNLLSTKGTSVVYGRYSFYSQADSQPRWKLGLYELLRDVSMELRHVKRPFLNSYGISMAIYKDQALEVGIRGDSTRGHDGRLCFDLMSFGKVRRLRKYNAAAWTSTRTLANEGSFVQVFWRRVLLHLSRFDQYFKRMPDHDTKTSVNSDDSIEASIKRIKKKTRLTSNSAV